jgi:hypothetical protein
VKVRRDGEGFADAFFQFGWYNFASNMGLGTVGWEARDDWTLSGVCVLVDPSYLVCIDVELSLQREGIVHRQIILMAFDVKEGRWLCKLPDAMHNFVGNIPIGL